MAALHITGYCFGGIAPRGLQYFRRLANRLLRRQFPGLAPGILI